MIKNVAGRYLTEMQINVILAESDNRLVRSKARFKVKSIITRLRRGAITTQEARQQLSAIIKDTELVDAIIEAEDKVYVISPATYISMMEAIPIPDELFNKRIEAIGMPEEEVKYYKAYARAKELEEEIKSIVKEVIRHYVEGLIDLDTMKELIDKICTLNGQVAMLYGVEWFVYSPREREMLVEYAKLWRERKEAKGSSHAEVRVS